MITLKRIVAVMLFLLALSGCTHRPVPVLGANTDLGGKTAVFLRFGTVVVRAPDFFRFDTAEGRRASCVDELQSRLKDNFDIQLLSLDTGKQIPVEEVLYSLPAEVADSDWVVFVLDPGSYCLVFNVYRQSKYEKEEFFLGVPATLSGVYVGSFIIDCFKRRGHENKLTWSELKIVDESTEATRVINTSLGGISRVTSLVSPYGQPQGSEEVPTAVVANMGEKVPLQTPAWKTRAVGKALGFGGEVKPEIRKDTDVETPLKDTVGFLSLTGGAILIPMGYLAYAPFGAAYGYVRGGLDGMIYGKCMRELVLETARLDLTSEARRILGASLSEGTARIFDAAPREAVAASKAERVASIELRRLQLRECLGNMAFCVEVEVRARVWDEREKMYVFAETLVYRHPFTLFGDRSPDEIEIEQASECRPISSYCGEGGKKILREELERGVEYLIRRALHDFGFPERAGQKPLGLDDKGNAPRNDREIQ